MRAVVVTETLDWRLHGLDLMTEHMATGDLPLMSASWMVGAQYKPSEIAKCEWGAIQQGPPWAVDSWGLGCLMQVRHDMCLPSAMNVVDSPNANFTDRHIPLHTHATDSEGVSYPRKTQAQQQAAHCSVGTYA